MSKPCACGQLRGCAGPYADDVAHDDRMLAIGARTRSTGRPIHHCSMVAGRLWEEIADIERERAAEAK